MLSPHARAPRTWNAVSRCGGRGSWSYYRFGSL